MDESSPAPSDSPASSPPRAPQRRTRIWWTGVFAVLAAPIAIAAVTLGARSRPAPYQLLRVTSGSMRPTLAVGQYVRVDTRAYKSAAPRVGDVIAFHAPVGATEETPVCGAAQPAGAVCAEPTAAESRQIFIKRVVGAPGDQIAVVGGAVLRNGSLEPRPASGVCAEPGCNFPVSVEVPSGEWFLMGDDRPTSDDSRYWGPVPQGWIIGKLVN